jgi:EAL domain
LQRAIATEQLELHDQPVVQLEDGSISRVEALLRWRHPERGMIPPDQFIPVAEETGLIVPIGRWVLREGCRQARRMRDVPPAGAAPTMSINLSVKQLQHSDVIADGRDAVAEAGIEPSALTLEITGTVLMADTDLAVTRLRELKALLSFVLTGPVTGQIGIRGTLVATGVVGAILTCAAFFTPGMRATGRDADGVEVPLATAFADVDAAATAAAQRAA